MALEYLFQRPLKPLRLNLFGQLQQSTRVEVAGMQFLQPQKTLLGTRQPGFGTPWRWRFRGR